MGDQGEGGVGLQGRLVSGVCGGGGGGGGQSPK